MNKAFTLVELAIVLTIVGLLAGGIIAAQSLIRSSGVRSLISQLESYRSATNSFKTQYQANPGDMRNATAFWGAADGGDGLGTDCTDLASDGTGTTCNGDGDGKIEFGSYSPESIAKTYESFRAWQHLSNAGMVEGSFTGIAHTPSATAREAVPGENIPEAEGFKGAGIAYFWWPSGSVGWFADMQGTEIFLAGKRTDREPRGAFLTASEMFSIDSKMDDGKPGTGNIQTWTSAVLPKCVDSIVPDTAVYLVSNQEPADACAFYLKN